MAGVAITQLQSNGVTSTFATILDLRWVPNVSADCRVGFFLDEATFNSGGTCLHSEYVQLDITKIVTTGNIPAQIIAQLTAAGAICDGGTPVA